LPVESTVLSPLTGLLEWFDFVRERTQSNFEQFDRPAHCSSPQDCLAIQGEMIRDDVEALLGVAHRLREQSMHLSAEAVTRIA
jgi:hypothetical protein